MEQHLYSALISLGVKMYINKKREKDNLEIIISFMKGFTIGFLRWQAPHVHIILSRNICFSWNFLRGLFHM